MALHIVLLICKYSTSILNKKQPYFLIAIFPSTQIKQFGYKDTLTKLQATTLIKTFVDFLYHIIYFEYLHINIYVKRIV